MRRPEAGEERGQTLETPRIRSRRSGKDIWRDNRARAGGQVGGGEDRASSPLPALLLGPLRLHASAVSASRPLGGASRSFPLSVGASGGSSFSVHVGGREASRARAYPLQHLLSYSGSLALFGLISRAPRHVALPCCVRSAPPPRAFPSRARAAA